MKLANLTSVLTPLPLVGRRNPTHALCIAISNITRWQTQASLTVLIAVVIVFTLSFTALSQERGGRIAPPSTLKCDRSDVTLYDGRVLTYRRRKGRTFLRVRTTFDTTEVVTLHHQGTDDPSAFFLLNGEPFVSSDWRKIERRKGVLKPGMRANVWVCRDNPAIQPVIDWRPDNKPKGGRQEAEGGGSDRAIANLERKEKLNG